MSLLSGLARDDSLVIAETAAMLTAQAQGQALAPRLLTVAEGKLPASVKEPYGPDLTVFGDPRGPAELGEAHGWPFIACPVHQVGWHGPGPCWCCAAGIAGVQPWLGSTSASMRGTRTGGWRAPSSCARKGCPCGRSAKPSRATRRPSRTISPAGNASTPT